MDIATSFAEALAAVAMAPHTGLLLALLIVAAVSDALTYRIPNWLTVTGMLMGLSASTLLAPAPMTAFLGALGGLAVGLVCLMPLHALRVMGAGDVKLMGAVGAFLGVPDVLIAIVTTLIVGGVVAFAWMLALRVSRRVMGNVGSIARSVAVATWTGMLPKAPAFESAGRLPYAVCILVGTTLYLIVRRMVAV